MRSCIPLVYITVGLVSAGAALLAQPPADADALYADRGHLASAQAAAAQWQRRLKDEPGDFDAAWKLARARHWVGDHVPPAAREAEYEAGAAAARTAVRLRPNRPEGHFWLGANLGGLAEAGGRMAGLRNRGAIREELETALRLDPAFNKGAAYCALSSYYLKVPALFGGSKSKSETLARQCVAADPESTIAHFFLAQTLIARGRTADAREELRRVLAVPLEPGYEPEGKEWKARASALLARLHEP